MSSSFTSQQVAISLVVNGRIAHLVGLKTEGTKNFILGAVRE